MHQVADWELYRALVAGDVVAYAVRIDPAIAKQLALAKGRAYQTRLLEQDVKQEDSDSLFRSF